MKPHFNIAIPKPCHEDWEQMTPKDKGRFCQNCSKVVIDFSQKSPSEIQDYLETYKHQKLCGRFYQSQLDSINLKVPLEKFDSKNIQKLFLLALLLCLGTTLFSCTNHHGQTQKIESVELIDKSSKKTIEIDSLETICNTLTANSCDSIPQKKKTTSTNENDAIEIHSEEFMTTGIMIIDEDKDEDTIDIEDINIQEFEDIEDTEILGFIEISHPPKFKNTPLELNEDEQRNYFSKKLSEHIHQHFDTRLTSELGLKGSQRIRVLFDINTDGFIENIRIRATHSVLETELKRVIELIPQLVPGHQRNNPVVTSYALPIIIDVDEE